MMILEFFILLIALIGFGLLWHFTHTWYKEREWRRNNPDEHKILRSTKQMMKE
tara:strand:+ start:4858 stop:5016 length:159 start_codon:yes stop_codon:yes gene_type:complete